LFARDVVLRLTYEAQLRELLHPLTLGQIAHYHDLGLRQRVLSLPALVCARLPRPLWDEGEAPARDQRAWPDILAAVPAAALLLFDRGVINCGLFAG
jgi:hypothetical protein